ncbi:Hypothetical protein A7982_06686 [Minicystis rosea]|nr:Hypothetical protein A7982_06686 [Minicystis rosea]
MNDTHRWGKAPATWPNEAAPPMHVPSIERLVAPSGERVHG